MPHKFFKPYSLTTLITGLPRSGTSLLAEIVKQFGGKLGGGGSYLTFAEVGRRGYNEHLKLNEISDMLLQKCHADFHFNLPAPADVAALDTQKERKKIIRTVNKEKIDIYKDNKLVVLADLYVALYPKAKWIFISRPAEETFRSRMGETITYQDWQMITDQRMSLWKATQAADRALYLDFNDLKADFTGVLQTIADYLDRSLTNDVQQRCQQCYMPRQS